jgi:hypothetical protein
LLVFIQIDEGSQLMNNSEDLYFVFLGDRLPKYVIPSLKIAVRHSGMNVNLIGDADLKNKLDKYNVNFIDTATFYDNTEFLKMSRNVSANHKFRNGFWLKTVERFFVLEQFMKFQGINSLVHAELDQLLFGVDIFTKSMRYIDKDGLYVSLHKSEEVIASLVYIQNPETLTSLLQYAQKRMFSNEMNLISDWGNDNPDKIFGLPTLASEIYSVSNLKNIEIISLHNLGGIVDAAQIGQWVAGIDPRNVTIRNRPVNNFIDSPKPFMLKGDHLKGLTFIFDEDESTLFLQYLDNNPIRIFNLHIHSKVHKNLLANNPSLPKLFEYLNEKRSISFSGTRRTQLIYYFRSRLENFIEDPKRFISRLRSRINLTLGIRPSSEPFISGDSFRKIANLVWEKSSSHFEIENVKSGSIIFCESDLVLELQAQILNRLNVPITLLLGNSDQNHDNSYSFLKNNSNVVKIFAQNMITEIDSFTPLPIGLENVWHANHGDISAYSKLMKLKCERKPRIMWAFAIHTNATVRSEAALELSGVSVADNFGSISSQEHRQLLVSYSFVASPPGNGLDTHRTWEAMYLGCVPIVLRSYMTDYYENLGLPIWIVNSYSELSSLDEHYLAKKYEEFKFRFVNKALQFDYWEKIIME